MSVGFGALLFDSRPFLWEEISDKCRSNFLWISFEGATSCRSRRLVVWSITTIYKCHFCNIFRPHMVIIRLISYFVYFIDLLLLSRMSGSFVFQAYILYAAPWQGFLGRSLCNHHPSHKQHIQTIHCIYNINTIQYKQHIYKQNTTQNSTNTR
jgi:hypothetical protein